MIAIRHTLLLILAISCLNNSGFAQSKADKDELSYKNQQRFERMFIDAAKAKVLGDEQQAIKLFESCVKIDADQAAPHYELAGLYMRSGNADLAEEHGARAAKLNPENYYYRQLYAEVLKNIPRYKDAASAFESIIKDFPKKFDPYVELAVIYILQKKYEEAIDVYDRLEGEIGDNEEVKLKKQYLYLQKGDVNKAAAEIEELIKMNPNEIRFYLLLAEVYAINEMEEKALKAFKRTAEQFPENPQVHMALSEYYHGKKNLSKAFEHLRVALASPNLDVDTKIKALLSYFEEVDRTPALLEDILEFGEILLDVHPENAKVLTVNGDIYMQAGRIKEARNMFMKAVTLDESRYPIWSQLLALEADLDLLDTLILHCDQALALFPNQPVIYYFRGYANSRQKQYNAALKDYQRGLDLVVDNKLLKLQFYLGLGETGHEAKEYAVSDKGFEEALKIDSNNTIALNNYSYYLSLRNEKLERAKTMSARSNNIEPNQPTYLDTYAWILYQMKEYDDAYVWMEKAIKHGGDNSGVILEHMGDICFQLSKQDEAVKYWQRASEVGGGSDLLEKKLKDQKLYE